MNNAKVCSGTNLNAQKGWNPLADGMLSTLRWLNTAADVNPFTRLNFVRAFMHWKNGRQMDRYIGAEIDKLYEDYKTNPEKTGESIMDLVLQGYMSAPGKAASCTLPATLDADFRAFAIRQVRLFIFVGYDANATVLCYCFHYLSKNPDILAQLRAEHNNVLGNDPAAAGSRLIEEPRLVNRLTYTLAVIKEVMRLFPPACGDRQGKAGVSITNDKGDLCETEDTIIQFSHITLHRNPKYWVRPNDFLPERWLVPAGHKLYPRPEAWRPFESGPRNCIAQAMVLIELRVMLACLVRTFEVTPAYDEYDEKYPHKGVQTVDGERCYFIERGAAHPTAGYP
jgi:cytochrome P450